MRILIVSDSAWDDRISFGNTISNWFDNWDNAVFYSIYGRDSLPQNHICNNYYRVSPLSLLKNLFWPSKTGDRVFVDSSMDCINSNDKEKELIQKAQQGKKEWMYLVIDLAYSTGIWKTKEYRNFIKEANPDVVFFFALASPFLFQNLRYLKRNTNAKFASFIPDDVYNVYLKDNSLRNILRRRRFKEMMKMSDVIYGASDMLKSAYEKLLGIEISTLFKGCTLTTLKNSVNNPIRIVYAGNLLWGRATILGRLAEELENLNHDGVKAALEIYTGTFITPEMERKLNRGRSSIIVGRRPYEEIVSTMKAADIVLHVESFDKDSVEIVRYSFSTKIIDCLQSGSTMMVIGPKGIASVEYPRQIPGAIVVDDLNNIRSVLYEIVANPQTLIDRSKAINEFAKKNHTIEVVRENLQKDFKSLLTKSSRNENY